MGKTGSATKNGKSAAATAAASKASLSRAWVTARTRRKVTRYFLWIAVPCGIAASVAYIGAPEPAPSSPDARPFATEQKPVDDEPQASDMGEAPPVDTWAKPDECQAWAGGGECTKNERFMSENCAGSCAALVFARQRYQRRCPKPKDYYQTLDPGQMPLTFARVLRDFPELEPEEISADPPVILFHNFLSSREADAFIKYGKGRYEKSLGVGMKADGTMGDVATEIRTSAHNWCNTPACLNDPDVRTVVARVANITQTPETNAEFAQLVYYNGDGKQFYRRHSDYIEGDEHKLPGVRIYTLFTYLNDVPEGGGTRFTDLPSGPVTFQPQRGKAILWPSVLSDDPHAKDDRTHHEALPVTAGEKFGANFWIHQYDFKGPHAKGCTV